VNSLQTYKSKRRLVQILSTLLIIALPFFNILRLDIPTLRFYFFNAVLWVDEFYLLFLVIMLIVFIIVIFSMMYGRVWCGWMCPQTVLNELANWFESKTKRWLKVPKTGGSVIRKVSAFLLLSLGVSLISLLIGFNLVAYFVDPYGMIADIAHGTLGAVTTGILLGIAVLIFVDVMFWREKFCTKACPYAMLQMVITDSKTQIVRYQIERDDECIECKACVRDCIMGIDIRTSPYQTECIHCGDCVDSCTTILSRLKTPLPTLINFSWGESNKRTTWYEKLGLIDAKRWIVTGFVVAYILVLSLVIQLRQPLSLTASGDRSTLYRQSENGTITNDYVVKISNRSMADGLFRIGCGEDHTTPHNCTLHIQENPVQLKSREVKTIKMSISTDGTNLKPGPNKFELEAVNTSDKNIKTKTEVVFFMPEPNYKMQ
jgi:cytochrome c oxidase accessory protein FixG